jgi:hypothetical protein
MGTPSEEENRLVYVVSYAWLQGEDLAGNEHFEVVHPCTLADLPPAQIYVNGNGSRPLVEFQPIFTCPSNVTPI